MNTYIEHKRLNVSEIFKMDQNVFHIKLMLVWKLKEKIAS